uniref:acyl-CoA dehydratase activase n=1 Tax=Desulfobacca sp. TaxID=2067990 RepID=UPI00404B79E1
MRPLFVGLDFGSRFVKVAATADFRRFQYKKIDSLVFYRDYVVRPSAATVTFAWPRLCLPEPEHLVVTGYGKHLFQGLLSTITEIRAHYLGACFQTGLSHFILLEIGGQDTKALYIKEGRVFDFLTNDKCAAGTGRYLENMAKFLKMSWREFTAAEAEPVSISNTCAIFGETELISHLLDGVPLDRLAAGVNDSVARRALQMIRRFPCQTLVFVGGVARNLAVVAGLRRLGRYQVLVPANPQFNGALGCCLEAGQGSHGLATIPAPRRSQ